MNNIDWSKAPEGATHWANHPAFRQNWHKFKDGDLYFYCEKWCQWISYGEELKTTIEELLVEKPKQQDWNGEGLPHAGVVCEVLNTCMAHPKYEKCTIRWIGHHSSVYDSESCIERAAKIVDLVFRPIKTEEEKYQEELSKAAKDYSCISHIREAFKAGAAWQKDQAK